MQRERKWVTVISREGAVLVLQRKREVAGALKGMYRIICASTASAAQLTHRSFNKQLPPCERRANNGKWRLPVGLRIFQSRMRYSAYRSGWLRPSERMRQVQFVYKFFVLSFSIEFERNYFNRTIQLLVVSRKNCIYAVYITRSRSYPSFDAVVERIICGKRHSCMKNEK